MSCSGVFHRVAGAFGSSAGVPGGSVMRQRCSQCGAWVGEGGMCANSRCPVRVAGAKMDGTGKLITNLYADSCVEVACIADRNGVRPTRYGALPPQMAAVSESNARMFDLAATAAIEKSKSAAMHALMLDPLSAAVCSPAEIKAMALELFKAQRKFLKGYK